MKKIFIVLALLTFGFSDVNHELNIPNMGCAHCAKKVENAAKKVKGFKAMSFDLKTKYVNITTADGVSRKKVIDAIKASKEKKFQVGVK